MPSAVSGRPLWRTCASTSTISRMRARNQGSIGGGGLDVVVGQAVAHGLGDQAQPVGRLGRERLDDGGMVGRAGDVDLVKAGEAGFQLASAFCSDSWMVRPMAIASPTDFIAVVSSALAPGNFSKAKRGILVTT